MAKIKYSALVSDMRGKLNGSVMSKNHYGSYMRNKVTPSNPQTIEQVKQRGRLAQFSSEWRGLSETERQAWRGAVGSWERTNIFGDVIKPTGNILYNRVNLNIATVGGTKLTTPNAPVGIVTPADLEISQDTATSKFDVNYDDNGAGSDDVLIIEATENVSPGVYNVSNKYRILATEDTVDGSTIDLSTIYSDSFGDPVVGQKIYVRLSLGNKKTGERSQFVAGSVIVS